MLDCLDVEVVIAIVGLSDGLAKVSEFEQAK